MWPPSSLAILLDLIQMPGIEPDQTHDGATAFSLPPMTRGILLIWLSLMWMAISAILTGPFVVLFQVNPAGPVMVVKNHEVLCITDFLGGVFLHGQDPTQT